MSAALTRERFWLPTPGGAVAACLHLPGALVRREGIVVCPSFGYEYTHTHRSLVHLADELSAAGFPALRIDYPGTGDSEGDWLAPDLLERWVAAVAVAGDWLAALVGGGPASLVGLRFGSLLAGLAAARTDVHHLVCWHPVRSGRRWVREHRVLQRVAADEQVERAPEILEAGGFVLAKATADALEGVDLLRSPLRVLGQVLLVDRDDAVPDTRLEEHVRAQAIPVRSVAVPGYAELMAEPQYTVVPRDAIRTIVGFLDEVGSRESRRVEELRPGTLGLGRSARWTERGVRIEERLEDVPLPDAPRAQPLVGVLTRPCGDGGWAPDSDTVVVLANSGSVHHVGPNRLYVELARELAREGVASLRLDLRNLGDSVARPCADENHPYPATAVEDVGIAVEHLLREHGFGRCMVGGLCSGAHTAFHVGLESSSHGIAGAVCINPLTFQWEEGMSLDTPDSHRGTRDAQYYRGALRSWKKWIKLLRGQADVRYILRFVLGRTRDVTRMKLRDAGERIGLRPPRPLGQRLERYRASGRSLRFIFSTNDPGYAILRAEAGPTLERLRRDGSVGVWLVEGADHTFSRRAWRQEAAAALLAAVRSLSPTSAVRL